MHAEERERFILDTIGTNGFVSYRSLETALAASPATIRRDLVRLQTKGLIARVHGGARLVADAAHTPPAPATLSLAGTPFDQAIHHRMAQKQVIGRAAAALCDPGEGIMIDGGTTTFQMCPHLDGLGLQVLTNSLHIVSALLSQLTTRILLPSGAVFREQNIILAPAGEESMPRFHAPKLFMGAASVGAQGIMQADTILVAAERRLIERAERVILCVDSSKFRTSSGAVVCELAAIDTLVTDEEIEDATAQMIERAGVKLVVASI